MKDNLIKLISKAEKETSEFEELIKQLVQGARLQKAYYDALVSEGFTADEALKLVKH